MTMKRGRRRPAEPFVSPSLVLLVGYCVYVTGVIAPAWRLETGYVYGLWVRCDGNNCSQTVTGFSHYLALVRCGIMLSLVLLTSSVMCVLLEFIMRTTHTRVKHITRTRTFLIVTAVLGEILAAASLALYGCKTVMAHNKLPALSWGFAVTGLGVIICLLGSILRAMGPPSTWGDGICCLAPSHLHKRNLPVHFYSGGFGPSTSDVFTFHDHHASRLTHHQNRGEGKDKSGLVSCFHKSKKSYWYSSISIPSTASSSLDRGYRHYEEISFEDMPPPPLELLSYLPPSNFSQNVHLRNDQCPAYPNQDHSQQSGATSGWKQTSYPHLEYPPPHPTSIQPQQQPHQFNPLRTSSSAAPSGDSPGRVQAYATSYPSDHPPITPRHTKVKQRSVVTRRETAAIHQLSKNSSRTCTQSGTTSRPPPRAQVTIPRTKYQTMPVKPIRQERSRTNGARRTQGSRRQHPIVMSVRAGRMDNN